MTGADLKSWRKRLYLTQAQAAKHIGCARTSIQNWEANPDANVPRYIALAVAAVSLNIPPYGAAA